MFIHCCMPGTVPGVSATVPYFQVCVGSGEDALEGKKLGERDELQ